MIYPLMLNPIDLSYVVDVRVLIYTLAIMLEVYGICTLYGVYKDWRRY